MSDNDRDLLWLEIRGDLLKLDPRIGVIVGTARQRLSQLEAQVTGLLNRNAQLEKAGGEPQSLSRAAGALERIADRLEKSDGSVFGSVFGKGR